MNKITKLIVGILLIILPILAIGLSCKLFMPEYMFLDLVRLVWIIIQISGFIIGVVLLGFFVVYCLGRGFELIQEVSTEESEDEDDHLR